MRRLAIVALAAAALAHPAVAMDKIEVRDFARDFLGRYMQSAHQLQDRSALASSISGGLDHAFTKAIAAESDSAKITPAGDKPCLWEGDVYFSHYEGITEYRLSDVHRVGTQWHVPVGLTYHEASGPDHEWTDILVITESAEGLRVDDVIYPHGGRLKQALLNHCDPL